MEAEVRLVLCSPSPLPEQASLRLLPRPWRIAAECATASDALRAAARWSAAGVLYAVGPEQPSPSPELAHLVRQGTGLPVICLLLDRSPQRIRDALVAGAANALMWPGEAAALPDVLMKALADSGSQHMIPVRGRGLCIALHGSKGGVGVTRLAVELGLAFRTLGHDVLVGDLSVDMDGPHALLGLSPGWSVVDLMDVAAELTQDQLAKVMVRHASGVQFVCGPDTTTAREWAPDLLTRVVMGCSRLVPVTIWDVPAAHGGLLESAWTAFSHVLCVTTPDAHAVYPLKRRILATWNGSPVLSRLQLVVNRRTPDCLIASADLARELRLPLAAEIHELAGLSPASGTDLTAVALGKRKQGNTMARQILALADSLSE